MDPSPSIPPSSADELARNVGRRLKAMRLAAGWTQEELATRSSIALSTLKLLESTGKGSFHRLVRVAVALGAGASIRDLFASTATIATASSRRRAPRRKKSPAGS